jgi:hypothetical protein
MQEIFSFKKWRFPVCDPGKVIKTETIDSKTTNVDYLPSLSLSRVKSFRLIYN